jgi:hypothetical protein
MNKYKIKYYCLHCGKELTYTQKMTLKGICPYCNFNSDQYYIPTKDIIVKISSEQNINKNKINNTNNFFQKILNFLKEIIRSKF